MMTGTAAATFPISSSVCMIFLIRAWGGGTKLGPRRIRPRKGCWGVTREGIPGERGRGAPTRGEHGRGRGVRAPEHRDAPALPAPPSPGRTWSGVSREPGPLFPGPATCSPAGTARYTSSSCSASQGLSRCAGPSAAARSFPAPGPARRPPAAVPPGPGAACSAPAAPHGVLAPPFRTPLAGPECPPFAKSLPGGVRRSRT